MKVFFFKFYLFRQIAFFVLQTSPGVFFAGCSYNFALDFLNFEFAIFNNIFFFENFKFTIVP